MVYSITGFNEDGFTITLEETYKETINVEFNISEFDEDINYDTFKQYVYKKIETNYNPIKFCLDLLTDEWLSDLIESLYKYYFGHTEISFKTGESITANTTIKSRSRVKDNFQINFMLEKYPSIWNSISNYIDYSYSNTDYQLFISEISKTNEQLWKLELIMTKTSSDRYSLGGRFKFFVKLGDVINLKYYEESLYNVKAKVVSIDYNSITLSFSGYSIFPNEYEGYCCIL